MALTADEVETLQRLEHGHAQNWAQDEKHHRYVTLTQRIEQLGMAIPPSMRRFLVVANWPRVVVRTLMSRQSIRALILPGQATADERLSAIFRNSNMVAQMKMFRRDAYTYGRAFLSVGANARDPEMPIIRAESPRDLHVEIDPREEVVTNAARFYGGGTRLWVRDNATLYQPNQTVRCERDANGYWREIDRRVHNLGRTPIIAHFNERWSGEMAGESELTDIIPLTDSVARSMTNLQFAQEAHGIPRMWMSGVSKNDFINPVTGELIPMFEAYFDAIHTLQNADAKVGQLMAADLKNFETAVQLYGKQAAIVTGFPARYFGITTTNPATEGAVIADEVQLVRYIEDKNESEGVTVGWTAALAYRFSTGEWIEGNQVGVEHLNPATPTMAQTEDALMKRRSTGVLSREGYWDELGWSEARKAKEREYLAAEAAEGDAYLAMLAAKSAPDTAEV